MGNSLEAQLRAVTALSCGTKSKGPVERLGVGVLSEPDGESTAVGHSCVGCRESADLRAGQMIATVVELGM